MRSWSISVGRLFGVDVRIHITFLVLPLFIYYTDYATRQQNANGPRDLAIVGIILGCVGVRELGRLLASRRFGLIPKAVILLPLTGVSLYDESRGEKPATAPMWEREVRLALIGPFINLALAGFSAAAIGASGRGIELWTWPLLTPQNLPRSVMAANLFLGVLNFIPAYPLDGGRLVRVYFARTMDISAATRRAVAIVAFVAHVQRLGDEGPQIDTVGHVPQRGAKRRAQHAPHPVQALEHVRTEPAVAQDPPKSLVQDGERAVARRAVLDHQHRHRVRRHAGHRANRPVMVARLEADLAPLP